MASAGLNGAGYLLNGYDRVVWYDEVCHLFTMFAVTAAIGWLVLQRSAAARDLTRSGFAAAAVAAGLVLGISWEAVEYVIGIIGDLRDTVIDLALDTLGALLAAAWLWHVTVRRAGGELAGGNRRS